MSDLYRITGGIDIQPVSQEHPTELVFLYKSGNRIVRPLADNWKKNMGKMAMKLRN